MSPRNRFDLFVSFQQRAFKYFETQDWSKRVADIIGLDTEETNQLRCKYGIPFYVRITIFYRQLHWRFIEREFQINILVLCC